jgi:hypothetical protein
MSIPALRSKSESRHRTYTRTEESRYVYMAKPNGEGGTIGATNTGSFSFKAGDGGKPPVEKSGSHAGMLGGEVDAAGNLIKGATQHIIRDGDQMRQEIRGDADPSIFIEKVGLNKPQVLKDQPFGVASATKLPLKPTMNEALDEFRCVCDFKADPLTQRTQGLSALKGQ